MQRISCGSKNFGSSGSLGGISVQGTGSNWGNENFEIPEKTVNRSYLIDKLDILYTSADGLINKRQELRPRVLINSLQDKSDVIAVTEIKPKNISGIIQPSEFNLDGYNVFAGDLMIKIVEVCWCMWHPIWKPPSLTYHIHLMNHCF